MKTRLVLTLLALTAVCGATTIVPMTVEQMTRAATDVAHVRVLHSWSAWNPQRTLIYTYSQVQIVQSYKGAAARNMVIKQLGGSAGGYTQKVAGIRYFQPGEDALLFLRPSEARDSTMVIVGLMQGNFRMAQTAAGQVIVSNGMPAVHTYSSGRIAAFGGSVVALQDMEARIQKALQ